MTDPTYVVETRWGGSEEAPSQNRLAEIVAELDVKDGEHPDTWLTHVASEWSLRLDEEGYAYVSDQGAVTRWHMSGVSRNAGLALWIRFAASGFDGVKSEPWAQGPRIYTPDELAARDAESARLTLESDSAFFELLGHEDESKTCRAVGCERGCVKYSVLCKVHHFEQIRNRPCPFA